jgi:hypothetical protein
MQQEITLSQIATFFKTPIACWPGSELILDWYHLSKKCYALTSLIARGRVAKKALAFQLLYRLGRGQFDEVLALLEAYGTGTGRSSKYCPWLSQSRLSQPSALAR